MAATDDEIAPIDWLLDHVQSSKHEEGLVPSTNAGQAMAASLARPQPIKGRTTFEHLPGELRNRVYDLSGCLRYWESQRISSSRTTVKGDHPLVGGHGRDCVAVAVCNRPANCRAAYLLVNGKETPDDSCAHHLMRWVNSDGMTVWNLPAGTACQEATVAQPSLTRVSKFTRNETLSIFYGDHTFVAKLDGNGNQLIQWLDTIGPANAGMLRRLYLVFTKKQDLKYIDKGLHRELQLRGLNVDPTAGVLKLVRMPFPFRYEEIPILVELDRLRALERKARS